MTALDQAFDWTEAEPADDRDRLFAHALRDPPDDPPAVIVGIPYDGAVLGRRGARQGPRALREALAGMKTHRFTGPDHPVQVADWGDTPLPRDVPVDRAHRAARQVADAAREAGAVPVVLGGDHSLTYPLARPHAEAYDALGVVNVDAHLDLREVDETPNSGSSFGRLLRDGHVDGTDLVEVGVRDFQTTRAYADEALERGVTVVPARDVRAAGPRAVVEEALEGPLADVDGLYLSLDVDAMDQAHAPGVSAPTPGGLTSAAFAGLAREVLAQAPVPVAGVDVVETAPDHDPTGRTASAAALALAHVLVELSGGHPP